MNQITLMTRDELKVIQKKCEEEKETAIKERWSELRNLLWKANDVLALGADTVKEDERKGTGVKQWEKKMKISRTCKTGFKSERGL